MFLIQKKALQNFFHRYLLLIILLLCFPFQNNLYSQKNTSIELTGGFAKSQESGIGSLVTVTNRITGNLFITASTGYLSFGDSEKTYYPRTFMGNEFPLAKEKFIIPFEVGGLIEFGEQNFRPFIKFAVGYNYAEYFVYDFRKYPPGAPIEYLTDIVSDYRTSIAASYSLGMGTYYFITPDIKLAINFTMQQISDINRHVRLMAGVAYNI